MTVPKTVTINDQKYTVTSIGENAFKTSKKVKSITIKTTSLTSVEDDAFAGLKKRVTIKLPKSKYTEYKKMIKNSTDSLKAVFKKAK